MPATCTSLQGTTAIQAAAENDHKHIIEQLCEPLLHAEDIVEVLLVRCSFVLMASRFWRCVRRLHWLASPCRVFRFLNEVTRGGPTAL